jgi:hypothetical protein
MCACSIAVADQITGQKHYIVPPIKKRNIQWGKMSKTQKYVNSLPECGLESP